MPATEADFIYLSTNNLYILAAAGLVGIIASTLKVLFGSYNPSAILREYKSNKGVETTYEKMFRTRENYCFHIASARARGEHDEAKRIAKDLIEFDKELDKYEERHFLKKKPAPSV
jgi:hypothetical protein